MMARDERGSAAMWIIFLTVGMLAMGALVIDGGYVMASKREAARTAEQAARVASDQLDLDSVRTGGSDVNVGAAADAARSYLASARERGTVSIDGDEVTVTVSKTHRTILMSAFGKSRFTVRSSATATSIDGPD